MDADAVDDSRGMCQEKRGNQQKERRFRAMQATYSNRPTKYFVCPKRTSFRDAL